jgi:hypothetical protein
MDVKFYLVLQFLLLLLSDLPSKKWLHTICLQQTWLNTRFMDPCAKRTITFQESCDNGFCIIPVEIFALPRPHGRD